MTRNKVVPSGDRQGPGGMLVAGEVPVTIATSGPSSDGLPTPLKRVPRGRRLRRLESFRLVQPFVEAYRRLPWTTRHTLNVAVHLYVIVYIFLTVPFRIAFYYNPYDTTDNGNANRWTEELSIFAAGDGIADLIGLYQFLSFYQLWKSAVVKMKSSARSEVVKKVPTDTDRFTAVNLLIRTLSFRKRRGKTKWTIATIEALSSLADGVEEQFLSQRKYLLACNMEFVLEIIAITPLEFIPVALGNYNALHLVRLTKLCRLYRLRRCLIRVAEIYSDRAWVQHLSSSGVDSLARNIGICAGLCHWVACGYMLIAHAQCGIDLVACDANIETSWVIRDRLFGASVARKYGRTLYWATRTLVLLGYDDVTPVSNAETIYAVLMTLLGALFGSSLLANFLFLFRFRNARYAAYSAHVDNAREYMRLQNIPRSVRHQVTAYYNYAWNTHYSLDSEDALQIMPKHLQSKVVSTIKASRIKQVCFLTKESVEFTNLLALALVRRIYSPGDHLIEPKVNAEMFFVIRGKVVLSGFDGSKPNECQSGDFFADSCLLFPDQYDQKAIAKTFCEVYVLAKSKFDKALAEFYRGTEADARSRMSEILEKYSMQLYKIKKLLGLRGAHESGSRKSSMGGSSHSVLAEDVHSHGNRSGISWRLPGSSFSMYWNMARLISIVYVAFEVPYFAVFISMSEGKQIFTVQPELGFRYLLTLLVEGVFGIDLVLRSRYFAYMDPDVVFNVVQPSLIFTAYKKHGFNLDLIAWIPLGLLLDSMPIDAIQGYSSLFRLLRLLRVRWIPSLLQQLSDFYGTSSNVRLVLTLVLGVTLMLHIVGCMWFEMTLLSRDSDASTQQSFIMSDLTRSECLQDATLFQNCSWVVFDCYAHVGTVFPKESSTSMYQAPFAYLRSVYWAIVTLTAVGYGDIVAYSTAESYFAASWIFVGGIINFGVVGAMSSTISNMLATHHHHMEKLNTLNTILERMAISEKLSFEIRRFYHHQFTGRKQTYESELLSHLPNQLCYQISSLLHSEAIKCVPLFDSASIGFLQEVTGKFRHRSFQNGETICFEGDVCREFFVLLPASKVNVFYHSRKVPVRGLHGGDCYGVSEFLLRRPYPATLSAASHVQASVMTREQFDVIQRKFSDDVNDMKEEAETLWNQDQELLRRIAGNLEKMKLQPHSMQTPTLFYQRESAIIPSKGRQSFCNLSRMKSTFKATWKTIISFWNVYNATFVIFRICFHNHLHFLGSGNTAVWIADLSCDGCFAVDVCLQLYYFGNFDVGIGNLVDRKKVNKRYLHSSALKWDLLASLPIYTPFPSSSLIAGLCRLPRLIRCIDLWEYLDDVIVQIQQHFATHNVSAYLSPAKLMIILGLVAHYVGCIFFLISEHECDHIERCWMAHDHLLHQYHHSVPMLYAKSFYWAITTLLLVGSRESVPRDTAGTLWTGFTCLCCTFIIGHIVGEISELILELGKETKQFKSRIASFESFAKDHDLPPTLRKRVSFFFRAQFEHTKGNDLHKTVNDLSANLRLKLMLEIYGHAIANLPICRFLTSSQVNNLALRLRSELFIPGDNILVEGSFGNRLCTLRKGLAAAYWTKSVSTVAVLMEGAFFGEIAFFLPNQRRLATVRATTFCEVLHVSKHDWQELWTTNGNASDNQIQKHALHAILGWVTSRLQRYQHASLRVASRAKRITATCQGGTELASAADKSNMKTKNKLKSAVARTATPPRKPSKTDLRKLFTSPQMQLLEKKTEYLLTKTDECAKKSNSDILMMQYQKSSKHASVRTSLRNSITSSLRPTSRSRDGASSIGGVWHSHNGDVSSGIGNTKKADDIRLLQFIVDLNPINKHVRDSLSQAEIRAIEEECWARSRQLAEAEHVVSKLLDLLLPSESGMVTRRSRMMTPSGRKRLRRSLSWQKRKAQRKSGVEALDMAPPSTLRTGAGTKPAEPASNSNRLSDKFATSRCRRFSVSGPQEQRYVVPSSKTELVATLMRMTRCHSLPVIENYFFGDTTRGLYPGHINKDGAGIDFDIIQRCQRPEYITQLNWYHRYREWKVKFCSSAIAPQTHDPTLPISTRVQPRRTKGHAFSLTGDNMQIPGFRRLGRPRVAAMGSRLQLPSQRTLLSATTDLQSKQFIRRVKEIGKLWDLAMLMVASYHLVVTPFKLSFAYALVDMSLEALRTWSALEMFLDVFCVVDLVYQLRHACMMQQGVISTTKNSARNGVQRIFASDPELEWYIVAMLPLELLLLSNKVRVPLSQPAAVSIDASWWASRWFLRMNRMLFVRRIKPLSEKLFQYVIHDLKLSVSEPLLYFIRSLASYLATGHILACIWLGISEIGFHNYGTSWLSTSGMLTYIAEGETVVEHSSRMLSESASTFVLASISLTRKYLRSLLFSMECVSTLFYGDILSMNPLELLAEIAITLWSIYIYGALVGAQAELLNARARREAAFEQSLGELQHYVVQNGVPKALKRQIKAYYARIWRRSRGDHEFAAVSNVSRALYEDVVLTTLRNFVAQVRAFRALDEHFLRALLVCMQYVVCSENEEVFVVGDVDRSMYFIAQGRILVRTGSSEFSRERGEYFGELTLLYGISRLETCVTLTVAELYRLDHEPYEHLLLEFPEYRARNKLAWTTLADTDRLGSIIPQRPHTTLASRPSIAKVSATAATNVDARLQYSFVHTATMKMLANMQVLHPLEAKDLILKCREGARRHLIRSSNPQDEQSSAHSDNSDDVQATKGPGPDSKLLRVFEKNRALRAQQQ
ncbi:unnamed protein product [Phytophthora lilii]|uniref:Unnamed protein product n=1 Tax=Phytophthora lilii TaxID=2077276 RepID=A0A9W6TKI3_9STRA|nr:unnamed protein product [Phytophthora lilii]